MPVSLENAIIIQFESTLPLQTRRYWALKAKLGGASIITLIWLSVAKKQPICKSEIPVKELQATSAKAALAAAAGRADRSNVLPGMNFLDELRGCGIINSSSLQLIKCLSGETQNASPLESWGAASVSQVLMERFFIL